MTEDEPTIYSIDDDVWAMIEQLMGVYQAGPERVMQLAVERLYYANSESAHCLTCPYGGMGNNLHRGDLR